MGRKVVETHGMRRLVKEYADDGTLARIRVEPIVAPPAPKRPRASLTFPSFSLPKRKPREAPVSVPSPEPFAAPPQELPVTVEPYEEPEPRPAHAPPPLAPVLDEEPWEETEPIWAPPPPPEPEPAPVAVEPAPDPEPELVRRLVEFSLDPPRAPEPAYEPPPVERAPEPEPEPIVEAPLPPPRRRSFSVVAVERVELKPETLSERLEHIEETLEPAPTYAPPPAPEPVAEDPPAAPAHYHVPDLDARVDALFAKRDRPVKAKKRAPLPVPQFEPLAREPWEDRLDARLSKA